MLIGVAGKDPEVRTFQDGGQVCNFTLATSEIYTDRNGEKKDDTTWHNIVLGGRLASISQYIHKGSKLYVEGKIRNRTYQTQGGETKYITEVIGTGVQLLDPKPSNGQQAPAPRPTYQAPAAPVPPAAPAPQPPITPNTPYPQPEKSDFPW